MQFSPQDITEPTWDLDPNSMDLIHMRLLGGCVVDWRTVYQNAFQLVMADQQIMMEH